MTSSHFTGPTAFQAPSFQTTSSANTSPSWRVGETSSLNETWKTTSSGSSNYGESPMNNLAGLSCMAQLTRAKKIQQADLFAFLLILPFILTIVVIGKFIELYEIVSSRRTSNASSSAETHGGASIITRSTFTNEQK